MLNNVRRNKKRKYYIKKTKKNNNPITYNPRLGYIIVTIEDIITK